MPSRVRIVGDHPHRGATGTVRDDLPSKFGMWQIDLDPSALASACYAGEDNLRALPADEDREGAPDEQ